MKSNLNPQEILEENKVFIVRGPDLNWEFEHNGKRIPQPEPFKCYDALIKAFGITEPRLKNFR